MRESENYRIGEREKSALRMTRVFRGLPDKEFEELLRRSSARGARFEKNATVAEAESRRVEFMILLSGRVQGVREQEEGAQEHDVADGKAKGLAQGAFAPSPDVC